MTVRCIYGCRVQERAEKAGMKAWCDDHCKTLGYERAFICYAELKDHGIDAKK